MQLLSTAAVFAFYILAITLVGRAIQGRFLSQFHFFYSYVAFMLATGAGLLVLYYADPPYYSAAAWVRLLLSNLAEFAVLVEISNHIFKPYPAIRGLGCILTLSTGLVLFLVYILPFLFHPHPFDITFLELTKRISLAKGAIILVLLGAARSYRLLLSRNVSGMILGFALYLSIGVASHTAAQYFGEALYSGLLNIIFLLSYDLCLLVWAIALWRYEPVQAANRNLRQGEEPLSDQLVRFDTTLMRLLGR
jgi:hypothetical protein